MPSTPCSLLMVVRRRFPNANCKAMDMGTTLICALLQISSAPWAGSLLRADSNACTAKSLVKKKYPVPDPVERSKITNGIPSSFTNAKVGMPANFAKISCFVCNVAPSAAATAGSGGEKGTTVAAAVRTAAVVAATVRVNVSLRELKKVGVVGSSSLSEVDTRRRMLVVDVVTVAVVVFEYGCGCWYREQDTDDGDINPDTSVVLTATTTIATATT
mmetsp:Transcript_29832/g.33837  ORF Transcript_29832/g.33837 Transcript_29832/m.33837 type:complete len:216 (+) Transcript_29832:266-913(+)